MGVVNDMRVYGDVVYDIDLDKMSLIFCWAFVAMYIRCADEDQPPCRWTSSSEHPPPYASVADTFLRLCRDSLL